jgi:hypothetical protein
MNFYPWNTAPLKRVQSIFLAPEIHLSWPSAHHIRLAPARPPGSTRPLAYCMVSEPPEGIHSRTPQHAGLGSRIHTYPLECYATCRPRCGAKQLRDASRSRRRPAAGLQLHL